MIGFYNYTVILTYMAVMSAVLGITQIMEGNLPMAIILLMVSGGCDMFDGKVARTKKDRTDREKIFGIQIDSLSDVICFGVFPSMFNYAVTKMAVGNMTSGATPLLIFGSFVSAYFSVAAVARLGYFNVVEEERQRQTSENRKNYQGLPVTTIAIILPIIFLLKKYIEAATNQSVYAIFMNIILLIVGFLFVYDFKIRKPSNRGVLFIVLSAIIIIAGYIILY